jgi:hypothetical protein
MRNRFFESLTACLNHESHAWRARNRPRDLAAAITTGVPIGPLPDWRQGAGFDKVSVPAADSEPADSQTSQIEPRCRKAP